MALIGNRSVLHKSPGRFLSGTIASGERNNFGKAGMLANRFQAMSYLSGMPSGHLSPSAWSLPRTAGGMSSHNVTKASIATTASGAAGFNIDGATSVSLDTAAIGQLVASAIGDASFSVLSSGGMIASISAEGTGAFSIASTGSIGAIANGTAAASFIINGSISSYAVGNMVGSTAVVDGLTPASIAAQVRNELALELARIDVVLSTRATQVTAEKAAQNAALAVALVV